MSIKIPFFPQIPPTAGCAKHFRSSARINLNFLACFFVQASLSHSQVSIRSTHAKEEKKNEPYGEKKAQRTRNSDDDDDTTTK